VAENRKLTNSDFPSDNTICIYIMRHQDEYIVPEPLIIGTNCIIKTVKKNTFCSKRVSADHEVTLQ